MLDLPPGRLAPRTKLISTRSRPRNFGLETIDDKPNRKVTRFQSRMVKATSLTSGQAEDGDSLARLLKKTATLDRVRSWHLPWNARLEEG